jgi:hypothetical protein
MSLKRTAILIAALSWAAPAPAHAGENPIRIQIKVDDTSVTVGASVALTVVFLDRNFRPVPNDRDRTIRLDLLATGDSKEGRAEIVPAQLKVAAGLSTDSAARFRARSSGTVLVRATSDGLAPGEAAIRIRDGSKAFSRLFVVPVYAQDPGSRQLQPARHEPIPLNHISMAQFSIIPNSPIVEGARVSFRIATDPAVQIRYGDRESMGSTIVHLVGGEDQSSPIYILPPSRPARIQVSAQQLPDGELETVVIAFVPPHPVSIGFDREAYTAKSDHRIVPLSLQLRDKDLIPLDVLGEPREIKLESAAGSSWTFEPSTVRLSGTSAAGTSKLQLPWFRFGRDLKILAEGDALKTGEADVRVMATEFALIVLALLGGFCGGLARHVYVVRTPHIMPGRIRGRLDPGLVGNALFSALSGLVLFKAIDLGIVHFLVGSEGIHDTAAMGFVLGVTGGFAGVLVFETLIERVVPAKARLEVSS